MTRSGRERRIEWKAPGAGWLLTAIAARRWDLDYLSPEISEPSAASSLNPGAVLDTDCV